MYSVNIYPNASEAEVHFSSLEEKDEYLKKEWKFCLKERQNYMSCNTQELSEAIKLYRQKRVKFAESQNYGPSRAKPSKWVKQLKQQSPKTVA